MPPGSWETHPDLRKLGGRPIGSSVKSCREADAAQLLLRERTPGRGRIRVHGAGDEVTLAAGGRGSGAGGWSRPRVTWPWSTGAPDGYPQLVSSALVAYRRERTGDGHRSGESVGSLRAQLGCTEMDAERVEVVTIEGLVEGRVRAVGRDHLDLIGFTGLPWMVALQAGGGSGSPPMSFSSRVSALHLVQRGPRG